MNQEIKIKWLEGLRSGRYTQGKSALRGGDDTYCCLGVLCDVIDPRPWTAGVDTYDYGDSIWSVPENIRQQADLKPREQSHLIHLNDVKNQTFLEIADFIEKEL